MLMVGLCFGLSSSSQWISPLFIGVMEEGYEVLIWHESWPLVQMRRIQTVGQKSPSQTAKARLHRWIESLSLGRLRGDCEDDHPMGIKLGCSVV
jgi:hypothetical protein